MLLDKMCETYFNNVCFFHLTSNKNKKDMISARIGYFNGKNLAFGSIVRLIMVNRVIEAVYTRTRPDLKCNRYVVSGLQVAYFTPGFMGCFCRLTTPVCVQSYSAWRFFFFFTLSFSWPLQPGLQLHLFTRGYQVSNWRMPMIILAPGPLSAAFN